MLHRIVSRSAVVIAATVVLAACEDNTTGTPLTPPPPSTAVYVNPIIPDEGYGLKDTTISFGALGDSVVTIVTPAVEFEVVYPDGTPATGQTVTFNPNLPGFVQQAKDTVDAAGLVSPGFWVLGNPCASAEGPFCRPTQRVIATPLVGNTGYIDVSTVPPAPPELHASR